MNAQILKVSEADYRNDQIGADGPSFNYSTAKTMVVESPLHAYHQHPRLGGERWEATSETDAGLVFHALLLDGGKGVEVLDFDDYRTNAAKAARDAARASNKVPALRHKFDEARVAVETIRVRMLDMGLELGGVSELAVSWTEQSKLGPVLCRAKIDHVIEREGLILDVKTTSGSVSPDECARRIYENGYDIQYAANTSWLEKYRPELVGRTRFVFVFSERQAPFAVTPVELDGQYRHMGRQRWKRAVETWARCLRDKRWPGYVTKVTTVEPKPWAFTREEELFADALTDERPAPPAPTPAKEAHPDDAIF